VSREKRESIKPYLTLSTSPIVNLNNNQLVFSFKFTNVGIHPVASLHSQTIVTDCKLDRKPLHIDQYSLVNNIPQNSTVDLIFAIDVDSSKIARENINQHYIIINLKYFDPILENKHEQIIYLRWYGITNGEPRLIIHATKEDKNQIVNYLEKY
jgi:hypothetical protein